MQEHDYKLRATLKPENIPAELAARDQWVEWRWINRRGQLTKLPLNARNGAPASTSDPSTWTSVGQALEGLRANNADGIGYVFSADDPFVGMDIDHCRASDTGEIDNDARNVLFALDSYREASPSGHGVHTIVKATISQSRRVGRYEVYGQARFFTVTGVTVLGGRGTIELRQKELELVLERLFGARSASAVPIPRPSMISVRDDDAILARIRQARNGEKFERLWRGDWHGYPSQSEADLALCSLLAWWVSDPTTIDRLFRRSGLYRPKWDTRRGYSTYGQVTIDKALLTAVRR